MSFIQSDTWYILGGGKSAQKYLNLPLYPVLTLNAAVGYYQGAATTCLDRHFATKDYQKEWEALGKNAHAMFRVANKCIMDYATVWPICNGEKPQKDKFIHNGKTCGLSAISLVVWGLRIPDKPVTIYLLGYDMDEANENWMGTKIVPRHHRDRIISEFGTWAEEWASWGDVHIYNTNPASALKCFPIREIT